MKLMLLFFTISLVFLELPKRTESACPRKSRCDIYYNQMGISDLKVTGQSFLDTTVQGCCEICKAHKCSVFVLRHSDKMCVIHFDVMKSDLVFSNNTQYDMGTIN